MLLAATASQLFRNDSFGTMVNPGAIATRGIILKKTTSRQTVVQSVEHLIDLCANSLDLMEEASEEFADAVGGKVVAVGLKDKQALIDKIVHDYNGDFRCLRDGVRSTIVYSDDNIISCYAAAALNKRVKEIKDTLVKKSKTGLAQLNIKSALPNGLIGEMQLVTPWMYEAKKLTHPMYKEIDGLTKQFAQTVIPHEVAKKIRYLEESCINLHNTGLAWDGLESIQCPYQNVDNIRQRVHSRPAFVN